LDIKEVLTGMDARWKTEKSRVPGVPDGTYTMQLLSAEVTLSKASNNPMVDRRHVVVDGEQEGQEVRDRMMLHTDNGPYYANKWVELMGYQSPEDLADLPEVVKVISEAHPIVVAEVRRSGEFLNVRVQQMLEESATVAQAEESAPAAAPAAKKNLPKKTAAVAKATDPEEAGPAVGELVGFEFDGSTVQGPIEELKNGSAIVSVDGERYEVPLGELVAAEAEPAAQEPAEDEELSAELLAFAQTHNLPVDDGSTVEALKDLIGGYEWKKAELTPDEIALLDKVGVEMTAAPAPKPVAKPATKAQAKPAATKQPAKAAAKAAAKPVVKRAKK